MAAATFQTQYKQKCLDIVDELFRHPISEVFHDPFDPVADNMPDYLEVVQHPSDLSTVRTKLLNDRYHTLQDFKRDVNLIWENAVQYNGRVALLSYIAGHLSRIFQKRIAVLEEPSPDQWVNDFLKARSVLCKLFRTVPKGFTFANGKNPSIQDLAGVPSRNRVSPADLEFFQRAEEGILRDDAIKTKLFQIIAELEPSIDLTGRSSALDLSALSPRTLTFLKEWIRELSEEGTGP
jgi:hypothetical protein